MSRRKKSTESSQAYYLSPNNPSSASLTDGARGAPASLAVNGSSGPVAKKKSSWRELKTKASLNSKTLAASKNHPPTPGYFPDPVSHLSNPAAGAAVPSPATRTRTQGPPLASLYLVAGLPKQTHTWTKADPGSTAGLQHRLGAVGGWWRAEVLGSNSASSSNPGDAVVRADEGDDWIQRVQGKALKLALPREIEVIRDHQQPPSTLHSFSFELVPVTPQTALSNHPDLEPQPHARHSTSSKDGITYHGVTLVVFSQADESKTMAIRKALDLAPSSSTSSAGVSSPRPGRSGALGGIDGANSSATEAGYWLPYALTLVSKYPLYSLMGDYLRISWGRYSNNVYLHSRQMTQIIQTPTPKAGLPISLIISASDGAAHDPDALILSAPMPGFTDLTNGLPSTGWEMWPFFKCLSIDNIITCVEVSLSPNGRVLFHSRHAALIGPAVMTLSYIAELKGWDGVSHPIVHARDVQLLVEDQGPWILGLDREAIYVTKPGPDIVVCDLDTNFLSLARPAPGVVSTGQAREKKKARLLKAFGDGQGFFTEHAVPPEFAEAYPGGRLRPCCETRTSSGQPDALSSERIVPPQWWNQARVMVAFDALVDKAHRRPSFMKRMTGSSSDKVKPLSVGEKLARSAMRKRANTFVDARDEMEGKLGRLSRRLAFLVHETDVWKDKFSQFEALTERLSDEANELKARIEKEKRESRRLSGVLGEREKEKESLRAKLRDTEAAREAALGKMDEMQNAIRRVELERDEMIASIEESIESALERMHGQGSSVADSTFDASVVGSTVSSGAGGSQIRGGRPADALAKLNGTAGQHSREDSDRSRRDSLGGSLAAVHEDEAGIDGLPPASSSRRKRFSAMRNAPPSAFHDPLIELDDKIHLSSSQMADKLSSIQMKLELALRSVSAGGSMDFSMHDRSGSAYDESTSPSSPTIDLPALPSSSPDDVATPTAPSSSSLLFSAAPPMPTGPPPQPAPRSSSLQVSLHPDSSVLASSPKGSRATFGPRPASSASSHGEDFISADEGERTASPGPLSDDDNDGGDENSDADPRPRLRATTDETILPSSETYTTVPAINRSTTSTRSRPSSSLTAQAPNSVSMAAHGRTSSDMSTTSTVNGERSGRVASSFSGDSTVNGGSTLLSNKMLGGGQTAPVVEVSPSPPISPRSFGPSSTPSEVVKKKRSVIIRKSVSPAQSRTSSPAVDAGP